MNKRIYRLAAALLALTLTFGLAGCGDREKKLADLAFQTSPYYSLEEMPLPVEAGELQGCCTDGKSIWYLTVPAEDAPAVLCRIPLDGGEAEALPEYQSPVEGGQPAIGYVGPVLGGDGKLWVWEQFYIPPETDGESEAPSGGGQAFHLRQLDPDTGRELQVVDITAVMEDISLQTMNGMAVDETGTIFLADQKHIAAVDSQGQTLYALKASLPGTFFSAGAGGTLALLPDGTVGALTVQPDGGRAVRAIDRETRDWSGKEYSVHKNVDRIYGGSGSCAFYYIANETVYGIVPGEEIPLRLLPWSNVQLDKPDAVQCFALLEEGRAVILSSAHEAGTARYSDPIQVLELLPTDEAPEGGRVRLIYGTIGINYIVKDKVDRFNQGNKDYYIEYRDYSEGVLSWSGEKNTQVYQSALARLYTDMSAGQGPDILDESVPLDKLAGQGALEDLWPWIDADPDISRDGLMTHVLECMEVDGKLPQVCSGFEIETAVASAAVAGDRTSWTMEEMVEAFGGEMPGFYFARDDDMNLVRSMFYRFDRSSTLYYLVNMNLSRFADMETGACSFDSEDFKSLLRLAGSGEAAAESDVDLDDPYVRLNMGLTSSDTTTGNIEACQVFPWEGKPLLYARTLSEGRDLVIDDVLFSGREPLVDYEQRLWDAEIIYNGINSANGAAMVYTRYFLDGNQIDWRDNGFGKIQLERYAYNENLAADCVVGGADRKIYASYMGFPSAGSTGSSFTLGTSMGISAASGAKEGAWSFVRSLLLPRGNVNGWYNPEFGGGPSSFYGFAVNRETFEEQLRMQTGPEYWTDPYSGEVFTDANGDPVEFSMHGIGVGRPGDIVLMAYLFAPTEAQMDRFWRLYESTEQITGRNDALLDIICEQAQPYFAGDKTLEETVKLIQNRASLYVNENK